MWNNAHSMLRLRPCPLFFEHIDGPARNPAVMIFLPDGQNFAEPSSAASRRKSLAKTQQAMSNFTIYHRRRKALPSRASRYGAIRRPSHGHDRRESSRRPGRPQLAHENYLGFPCGLSGERPHSPAAPSSPSHFVFGFEILLSSRVRQRPHRRSYHKPQISKWPTAASLLPPRCFRMVRALCDFSPSPVIASPARSASITVAA